MCTLSTADECVAPVSRCVWDCLCTSRSATCHLQSWMLLLGMRIGNLPCNRVRLNSEHKMSNREYKGDDKALRIETKKHFISGVSTSAMSSSAEYNGHNKQTYNKTYLVSSSFQAIRIPFPPPPADALIITGYPANNTLQIKPTWFHSNSLAILVSNPPK